MRSPYLPPIVSLVLFAGCSNKELVVCTAQFVPAIVVEVETRSPMCP
ncbi:MAG TPA: hypothetical protein VE201_08905 [Nitrospirales bacterium]|nr:hypothetical protein [Nitrospirales bacterium]